MDIENARSLVGVLSDAFLIHGKLAKDVQVNNYRAICYLFLSQSCEDAVVALVTFCVKDEKRMKFGGAFIRTFQGIPSWSDDECRKMLVAFGDIVTPKPDITTIEFLRERCLQFSECCKIYREDHKKTLAAISAVEGSN